MQYAWTVRQSLKNFQYFLRFTKKYIEEKSRNHIDFKKTIRYLNCRVFKVFFQKTVSHWRNNVFFYFYLSRNFFVSKINDCFFPVRLNDFKSFNSIVCFLKTMVYLFSERSKLFLYRSFFINATIVYDNSCLLTKTCVSYINKEEWKN